MKTKKISHAGRFGVRYGKTIRERFNAVQDKQKKRQKCPFCTKPKVKRSAKGIWRCLSCKNVFTGGAYYLNE
ncbi:MAG: 50S ribosomal protein L37ae [Nanoarchaeota archaeon]|nr:50S ribosomal protein L37ae [Nanoarchaeota archaeon]